ncbi:general transcription factor II-I repeat domain-containing protein 2A-like [Watersipora subatra]|uniref:general transcription factor II-I repeat domain-containing protein 2A-like n=1 Tax=Watersipora subatra TaxID=2589382 RepID=UPI00355C6864
MGSDIAYQIKVKLGDIECYSLAFNESTDIRDTAQLAVFIRAVDKDFNVTEELFDLSPLKDGAPSVIGCHNGLIAKVRELQPDVIAVHCIIHQKNLSAKIIITDHANSVVVKIINYIRSQGLDHLEFQEFLTHLDSQSEDVVYFTEVRRISRASTLQCFWLLLNEIILFLKFKRKEVQKLCDPLLRMDFALLNDISQKLSQLNVRLPRQDNLVHDLFKHLRTFERNLQLYEQSLREEKVDLFPTLKLSLMATTRSWVAMLREWQYFGKRFTLVLLSSEVSEVR